MAMEEVEFTHCEGPTTSLQAQNKLFLPFTLTVVQNGTALSIDGKR